jgi:peptidoglycan-associated lipoprotein
MAFNSTRPFPFLLSILFVIGLAVALGGCRKYPNCKKDLHCEKYDIKNERRGNPLHNTPFCLNRECKECRDDSHCERWQSCNRGTCQDIPGYCDDERPCPAPQVCRNNRCGPECLTDADCDGQFAYCQNGTCMQGECNTDADCPEGYRCEGRFCRAIPAAAIPCEDRRFRTVYYDFDQHTLTASARSDLQWNLQCLNLHTENVRIEGHCDERGTEQYNMALGERRARAARQFFLDNGFPNSRFRTVSYGESRPADPRSNEAAWRLNRRAEFAFE